MKIRFSIIDPNTLAQVCSEVDQLSKAVHAGDMDGVDTATEKLLELTAGSSSVELSEADWRAFLRTLRSKDPAFESRYILPGTLCTDILPAATAADYILELPIDSDAAQEDADV